MYLFFFDGNHKGWYISTVVFDTDVGYTQAEKDGCIQAWCGQNPDDQATKLHMPFFKKKALKGGTIVPYGIWAAERIAFI